MLRSLLFPAPVRLPAEPWTYRGLTSGRLESFSDSTFSFALTLLIITLDIPKSYDQLVGLLPQFFSFVACFAILSILWHRHVTFFRRYGLHDSRTVAINTGLLALILFYLYPLKFLMNTVGDVLLYAAGRPFGVARPVAMSNAQLMPRILAVYLFGLGAVSLAFALLHRRALQLREDLRLSPYEEAATRDDVVLWLVAALCAAAAATWNLCLPRDISSFGTFLLFAIPLARRLQHRRRTRKFA
jgi:uncharacterized membrane protein